MTQPTVSSGEMTTEDALWHLEGIGTDQASPGIAIALRMAINALRNEGELLEALKLFELAYESETPPHVWLKHLESLGWKKPEPEGPGDFVRRWIRECRAKLHEPTT